MSKSKNNPSSRNSNSGTKRFWNGVECKPILYDGRNVGKGKLMAAECNKEIVFDNSGRPIPYKSLPTQ